jgi:hemoglobin-like flavoprotein
MLSLMNYETVFNDSFGRILSEEGAGEAFFHDFYRDFLSSSPEVSDKFRSTDMREQQRMLKASFYHLLGFSSSDSVPEYLADVAEAHDRNHNDIRPGLYDLWIECLMGAVKKHDNEFSDDVELAWRLVMAKGIVYMKFRYAH